MPLPALRAFVAAATICGLGACDSSTSSSDAPRDPAALQATADRIRSQVEALRGLSFLRPVRASWVDRSHLGALMDSLSRVRSDGNEDTVGMGSSELVFQALGFIDSGKSLSSSTDDFYGGNVLAFYYRGTDHLWVLSDQASSDELEPTIAHELVHALIDQNFGDTLTDSVELDQAQAYQILHEGEANYVEDLWRLRAVDPSRIQWRTFTADRFLSLVSSAASLASYPKLLVWTSETPYTCGESYAQASQLSGGWARLDSLHRHHPNATASQFLAISGTASPTSFSDWVSPARFPSMADRPSLGDGRLGEVYLDALMDTWKSPLIEAWGGDRFWVWSAMSGFGSAVAGRTSWTRQIGAQDFLYGWAKGLGTRMGASPTWITSDSVEIRSSNGTRVARGVRRSSEVLLAWGDLRGGRLDSLWTDLSTTVPTAVLPRSLALPSLGGSTWKPPRRPIDLPGRRIGTSIQRFGAVSIGR